MTNKIRFFREQKGFTQEELAIGIQVSRQTIISIESGKYSPSTTLALKLAKLLGKKVEDLFSLEDAD